MSDTVVDDAPVSHAAKWLRVNLGVVAFLASLFSGSVGVLIGGTMRVAHYDQRLDSAEHTLAEIGDKVAKLEQDRTERDERRIKLASDLGVINQRLVGVEQAAKAVLPLQTQVQDMDVRGTTGLGQIRREIDNELANLSQRTAILEAQIKWLGGKVSPTK